MTNDKIEEVVEEFESALVCNNWPAENRKGAGRWLRTTLTTLLAERVEHCSEPSCVECDRGAYERGVRDERERIGEYLKVLLANIDDAHAGRGVHYTAKGCPFVEHQELIAFGRAIIGNTK